VRLAQVAVNHQQEDGDIDDDDRAGNELEPDHPQRCVVMQRYEHQLLPSPTGLL
jgi:hypothetical protein